MSHQFLSGFNRRSGNRSDEIRRPSGFDNRFVDEMDVLNGNVLGVRVHIENDAVARRDHADGVADNRGCRIRNRRNRGDDTIRSGFHQHQSAVAGARDRR